MTSSSSPRVRPAALTWPTLGSVMLPSVLIRSSWRAGGSALPENSIRINSPNRSASGLSEESWFPDGFGPPPNGRFEADGPPEAQPASHTTQAIDRLSLAKAQNGNRDTNFI